MLSSILVTLAEYVGEYVHAQTCAHEVTEQSLCKPVDLGLCGSRFTEIIQQGHKLLLKCLALLDVAAIKNNTNNGCDCQCKCVRAEEVQYACMHD